MDNELEDIKKKKMEEYKNKYMKGDKNMENMPNKPIEVTDADFDNVVKKYDMIIVDCWAPWCGPCRMVGPVIDELAKEMQGEIVFGKLNVDENPNTSSNHGIMSIPTLLVFKKGQLIDQLVGAHPKEILKKKIESY